MWKTTAETIVALHQYFLLDIIVRQSHSLEGALTERKFCLFAMDFELDGRAKIALGNPFASPSIYTNKCTFHIGFKVCNVSVNSVCHLILLHMN